MHRHDRRRSKLVVGSELLESRELLNAHMPHHDFAHVAKVAMSSHMQISGTLNGTSPYTTDPTNPEAGGDSYAMSGNTSAGQATVSGTDDWMGLAKNATTETDAYYGGDWTMTLSNGSMIAITYVGTGKYPVTSGPWTLHAHGEAIGISGSLTGHEFSFTANSSGVSTNDLITTHFKLKS